jgi:hypothetical protein
MKLKTSKKQNLLLGSAFLLCLGYAAYLYFQKNLRPHQQTFEVIFTGQTQGKIKSCGCSLQDLGGIYRRANLLARKSKDALVVDSGGFIDSTKKKEEITLYTELSKMLNYDVIHLTSSESVSLPDRSLNFVSLLSQDSSIPSYKTLLKGGIQYWVTGVSEVTDQSVKDIEAQIATAPPLSIPVILSTLSLAKTIELLKKLNVPALAIGHEMNHTDLFTMQVNNSYYITGGDRGRYLGEATLEAVFHGNTLSRINLIKKAFTGINNTLEKGESGDKLVVKIKEWERIHGELPNE